MTPVDITPAKGQGSATIDDAIATFARQPNGGLIVMPHSVRLVSYVDFGTRKLVKYRQQWNRHAVHARPVTARHVQAQVS